MIRTLFVSEARGIEDEIKSLDTIVDFKNGTHEKDLKEALADTDYDYGRIGKDIDAILDQNWSHAEKIAFLYTHGRESVVPVPDEKRDETLDKLNGYLERSQKEFPAIKINDPNSNIKMLTGGLINGIQWCYNLMNAKTPTPSTLLDVWQTTQKFFTEDTPKILSDFCDLPAKRIALKLVEPETMPDSTYAGGAFDAKLGGRKVQVLFCGGQFHLIADREQEFSELDQGRMAKLNITDKEWKGDRKFEVKKSGSLPYRPYRIITASPYLFMAIVPANQAVKISSQIYQAYQTQFGKVTGRLPFSIGNVFFKRQMPMFVVLDTARRMIANFKKWAEQDEKFTVCKKSDQFILKHDGSKKEIQWQISELLGDKKLDFYHPYALMQDGADQKRKGFFKTIAGDVTPFHDLEEGHRLSMFPNYYDFLFLDSNQRRHHTTLEVNHKEKMNDEASRGVFFLEELDQKHVWLWKHLKKNPNITQAKLKNLQALWGSKYRLWDADINPFEKLIKTTIQKEKVAEGLSGDQMQLLLETIKNGLFFRMLELQQSILKNKVTKDK